METKQQLRDTIKMLKEQIEDLQYQLDRADEAYCDLERQQDNHRSYCDIEALKEIIEQLEYKKQNWRKLDTIDDIVTAIKKEVLN